MSEPQRRRGLFQRLKELIRRPRKQPPGDPYADRLVPVRSGPKGRSGAAVAEPEDDSYRAFPPRR
jgi:hypothetical protein